MKKSSVLLTCILLSAYSSYAQRNNKLQQLSWLAGSWQVKGKKGTVIESWTKVNNNLMQGSSYFITNRGDTTEREHIRLVLKDGLLYYMPTVNNQNDGKEVIFKEKSFSPNEVSFENPEHDFPKLIVYKKISDNNIYAEVSAGEGSEKRIQLNYSHIK